MNSQTTFSVAEAPENTSANSGHATLPKFIVDFGGRGRSSASFSNLRTVEFAAIQEAVRAMAELPEESDFHIDRSVAVRATDLLGILNFHSEVPAPKIFPQEQDVLVLKWLIGRIERFLSVAPDFVDLLEIETRTRVRCFHELAANGLDATSLIQALSAIERNETAPRPSPSP